MTRASDNEPGVEAPGEKDSSEVKVTPEQARRFMRGLVLSELAGVLVLLGGAAYFGDSRALLLIGAVAYAFLAVLVTRYLRRDIYGRVEKSPFE